MWLKFTCVNVRSQKRISGNQPFFFFAFTVWQIISFTQHYTHGLHWYNLWTVQAYYFLFFFLSRWVLERVELEAGPEHPRIKIVPEDWFLWISKNEDDGGNLNGILWFFSWWRKHFLNTGIYSYLLCNSIQHCLQKVLHRTPTFWLSESVCIRDKQCSKEKTIGCYVQGKWSLRNELENSILINLLNKQ